MELAENSSEDLSGSTVNDDDDDAPPAPPPTTALKNGAADRLAAVKARVAGLAKLRCILDIGGRRRRDGGAMVESMVL